MSFVKCLLFFLCKMLMLFLLFLFAPWSIIDWPVGAEGATESLCGWQEIKRKIKEYKRMYLLIMWVSKQLYFHNRLIIFGPFICSNSFFLFIVFCISGLICFCVIFHKLQQNQTWAEFSTERCLVLIFLFTFVLSAKRFSGLFFIFTPPSRELSSSHNLKTLISNH